MLSELAGIPWCALNVLALTFSLNVTSLVEALCVAGKLIVAAPASVTTLTTAPLGGAELNVIVLLGLLLIV